MEQATSTLSDDRQYRILVNAVTDYAIYMLDADGMVASWNAGAQRFKGYQAADIVGKHFSCFYTEEDRKNELPRIALEVSARTGKFHGEGWRVRKDGTRFWASVVIDPIIDDNGKVTGFAKVTRDITDAEEARIALQQATEALFQSQKMEAVGQLTGGIAHDFNNLLTGISGCLEMLRTRLSQGRIQDLERYLIGAQDSVTRAASLTQRLLAFSRQQTLSPQVTDLNRLAVGMEDLIRRSAGPSVTVEGATEGDVWSTFVDPNQVENALLNLCINARDAMPQGGRLTIETANRRLDAIAARGCEMPPGDYVSLCVSDTGTGMTPEVMRRAFDPFFTTKAAGKGTGLGLSMVHGFVRQSGGEVRIQSAAGLGSSVCIYLPRHHGAEAEAEVSVDPSPLLHSGRGETVLVVDDEAMVRMLICDVLADMGFKTIEAAEGSAGLEVLQSDVRIDLVITDIGLPGGLDGRQMIETARQHRPKLKVLFITGYADYAIVGTASQDPGTHVMTKPFELEYFTSRIRDIISLR